MICSSQYDPLYFLTVVWNSSIETDFSIGRGKGNLISIWTIMANLASSKDEYWCANVCIRGDVGMLFEPLTYPALLSDRILSPRLICEGLLSHCT